MELRQGFTTGTCATAAAKAACVFIREGKLPEEVELTLPRGELVVLEVFSGGKTEDGAWASIIKDAGDDPDITHGIEIRVELKKNEDGHYRFFAGKGVGVVKRHGLRIPYGEAAINPTPRQMLEDHLKQVSSQTYDITVSALGGEELALKTFNPKLGIVGGISIIGTTGIVRPYNRDSMRESLRLIFEHYSERKVSPLVLTPGNIGTSSALKLKGITSDHLVEVGNEWGMAFDLLKRHAFSRLHVVGHPGKLGKLIRGDFNTDSRVSAPCLEDVKAEALKLGLQLSDVTTVEGLFESLSLAEQKILADDLAQKIKKAILKYDGRTFKLKVSLCSMKGLILGESGE